MSPVKDLTEQRADLARANAHAQVARDELTPEVVRAALVRHSGSYPKAARELGVSPDTLRRRVPTSRAAANAAQMRSDVTAEAAVAAVEEHGTTTAAARALDCSPKLIKDRLHAAGRRDLIAARTPTLLPPVPPVGVPAARGAPSSTTAASRRGVRATACSPA